MEDKIALIDAIGKTLLFASIVELDGKRYLKMEFAILPKKEKEIEYMIDIGNNMITKTVKIDGFIHSTGK